MKQRGKESPQSSEAKTSGFWYSRPAVLSLLLMVITIAVYWPVTRFDFVNLDDQVYVSERPEVLAGLTWSGIRWALTATEGGAWHPLTWLSLMLDGQLFGHRAGGYHATNLAWHVLNTLLLFGWLQSLTGARWRSALVAALFALHPLHVESVAWISERKDVLSTTFWLLSLWAYTTYASRFKRYEQPSRLWIWYTLSLGLFALGLGSKPMLVTLPCLLLLLDYWPLERLKPSAPNLRPLFLEKVPFFALSAAASLITVKAQRASDALASFDSVSPGNRIANAVISYVLYLRKTLWPSDLSVFYPYQTVLPTSLVLGAAIVLLVMTFAALKWRQRYPFLTVGWFWFLGTLVPVIGLVQVGGQSLADRYTYVPLIGLFIALVWGAVALLRKAQRSPGATPGLATLGGVALLACTVLTARQLRHWQNSETLFRHTLVVTANNVVAHVNLASTLLDQNRFNEAAEQCRLALAIRSDSTDALKNLGLALAGSGQWAEAIPHYQRALEINPTDDQALNSLGLALANQGNLAAAEDFFRRSLKSKANSPEALSNLGLALALQGRTSEAIDCYHRALQLNPREVKVLNNLGLALASQQQWTEALDYYRRALAIQPDYIDALVNSGAALGGQGRIPEAISYYRRALDVRPESLEALFNLGTALASQGQRTEAIDLLSRAQRLQPDNEAIQQQLKVLTAGGSR